MSSVEPLTLASSVADAVCAKLRDASGPLTMADLAKPKPKKMSAAQYQDAIRPVLDEQVRLGLAYRYPSGKNGTERFWNKDEKHLLREKAVEAATTPQTLTKLTTVLAKNAKGVDKRFVESVVRELDADGQLFEYPPAKTNGVVQFCASPPPPPLPILEQVKHSKAVDKLAEAARKLLAVSHVPVDELLRHLRMRLTQNEVSAGAPPEKAGSTRDRTVTGQAKVPSVEEIETLLFKELEHGPAVSIADVRTNMPLEYRGREFEETILRLADEGRIWVHEDSEPSSFSQAERAMYVQDGQHVYTAISKRG